ncbi:cytochrome-b5 reductase KNAG_0D01740 [Huiozyma naganishii CBS 8797]|uniref:NADH-cytochrome b5 reductase n=1 Tax=Huiozyma naganishii (strain ATCC MYA-139 / BCRC 22969 / CBS 8797 / KCTC 17520 / NBRC 10181 / NCYC 3082 / Yp74L-3) TaxID=1071383 RepID=J7R504_HUIN7|nr:hypothetical protein KNAG_0D01740 [Kazachstania naganishii CBS 8797]CCK69925.1 hypothetical protein KNAG_0D01740 [Kazachstania naganishii CBS 8797]
MVLGLPIGQHVSVRTETPDGKTVVRSYTPISLDEDARGYFELMVKSYASGTVSKRIGELKVGDSISVTGPLGPYDYKPNFKRHISMVAGGTGITPMFQLLKAISGNPKDKTRVSLIYGNASEEDILLKNEIDRIVSERPEQFSVYYLLDRVDRDDWEGGQGYVTGELMEKLFPRGSEPGTQLLLCGPPRMVSSAKRLAKELEYKRGGVPAKMTDQIFSF